MELNRIRELLALEILGTADEDELKELDGLRSGDDSRFAEILAETRELIAMIGLSAPAVQPPARVRSRLLATIRSGGHMVETLRSDQGWATHALPGIRYKELNRVGNQVTVLLTLDPDTTFPMHGHRGAETTYIVEGSIGEESGESWHAGDFVLAPAGCEHGPLTTEHGCTVMMTLALQDFREPSTNH